MDRSKGGNKNVFPNQNKRPILLPQCYPFTPYGQRVCNNDNGSNQQKEELKYKKDTRNTIEGLCEDMLIQKSLLDLENCFEKLMLSFLVNEQMLEGGDILRTGWSLWNVHNNFREDLFNISDQLARDKTRKMSTTSGSLILWSMIFIGSQFC